MVNILYIVPNPPSLVRVRPYNLVRHLAKLGHSVTVATVWSSREEQDDIASLRQQGVRVIAAPLSRARILRNLARATILGMPLQALYSETEALHQAIVQELSAQASIAPYDAIQVEHLRGACYGLALRTTAPSLPVVWDSVDCISYLFEQAARASRSRQGRWMARLELPRTRRYEARLVRAFDRVVVTSSTDRQALRDLAEPEAPIRVIPNGVDLDYFQPDAIPRQPATILFSGKMSYHANVTAALYFVHEIMPLVWRQHPDAKVVLAGKDPSPVLQRLPEQVANVSVTGTVPDLRPYLHQAAMAVSPLVYGAGIQNKVLEAMACATPVVASAQAVAALDILDGRDLLVAHDAPSFANQICCLLTRPDLRTQLGLAGRRYVEQNHDWSRIATLLAAIHAEGINCKKM